jgi:hypothetical protein
MDAAAAAAGGAAGSASAASLALPNGTATEGVPPPPASELTELAELEREINHRLRESERRLAMAESQYVQSTGATAAFGNIISGWEGLLEGKAPDKKRVSERIFSGE